MLAHNSRWPSQTLMIPPPISLAVSSSTLKLLSNSQGSLSDSHHRFTAEGCDWGFKRFSELQNLFQVQPGNGCPVIEGDSTVVSVYVRVLKDPTGALWNDFIR